MPSLCACPLGDLADQVSGNAGVYFVPAFNGLYAPHWDPTARGLVIGLTQFTNRCHIARAALESVCYQTREVGRGWEREGGEGTGGEERGGDGRERCLRWRGREGEVDLQM